MSPLHLRLPLTAQLPTYHAWVVRCPQATVLHSELSKLERTNILNAFRRGVFRAMVVTDVASRGLDFPQLDAVFNLGLPEDVVTYAHR